MNFISMAFLVFFTVFFGVYYLVPKKYRYIVLAIGSYVFYGWGSVGVLSVLLLTTLITYTGGILARQRSKKVYALFFSMNLLVLLAFKYLNFFAENVNRICGMFGSGYLFGSVPDLILPIGLSFYVFQSMTYLGDVYRGRIEAERNFLRYSAFVAFFPSILSGPIQKARILLPQIAEPYDFDSERAVKGFILFIWGIFQKIAVANNLAVIVNVVYDNYQSYDKTNTAYFIVAALSFSVYIYADFSSYSDMARGIAKILGIEIGKNFNNPYLSVSCSEFWRRWHVSLNEWLTENVYIPLGGNRKGKIRKYINVFLVFLISGIWHGASWNFVLWGAVNGIFVIIGQFLQPIRKRIYTAIKVDDACESIVFLRRIMVFWLITITWVFFRNDISTSLYIIKNIVLFYPVKLFEPALLTICGTEVRTLGTIIMVVIFCIIQYCRKDEGKYYLKFRKQPVFMQCMVLAVIIYICIFKASATSTTLNTQFLYFQF